MSEENKGSAEETWNTFVLFVADMLEREVLPTAHESVAGENDWNRAINEGIRHCIKKVRALEIVEAEDDCD